MLFSRQTKLLLLKTLESNPFTVDINGQSSLLSMVTFMFVAKMHSMELVDPDKPLFQPNLRRLTSVFSKSHVALNTPLRLMKMATSGPGETTLTGRLAVATLIKFMSQ